MGKFHGSRFDAPKLLEMSNRSLGGYSAPNNGVQATGFTSSHYAAERDRWVHKRKTWMENSVNPLPMGEQQKSMPGMKDRCSNFSMSGLGWKTSKKKRGLP